LPNLEGRTAVKKSYYTIGKQGKVNEQDGRGAGKESETDIQAPI
jgi:hypothetical protein